MSSKDAKQKGKKKHEHWNQLCRRLDIISSRGVNSNSHVNHDRSLVLKSITSSSLASLYSPSYSSSLSIYSSLLPSPSSVSSSSSLFSSSSFSSSSTSSSSTSSSSVVQKNSTLSDTKTVEVLVKRYHCLPWAEYIVYRFTPFHPASTLIRWNKLFEEIADLLATFINQYRPAHELSMDEIEPLFESLIDVLFLHLNKKEIPISYIERYEDILLPQLVSYLQSASFRIESN